MFSITTDKLPKESLNLEKRNLTSFLKAVESPLSYLSRACQWNQWWSSNIQFWFLLPTTQDW